MEVALTPTGESRIVMHLPVPLSRALLDGGYNAVRIELRDDGILLIPFYRPKGTRRKQPPLSLPAKWTP